MTNEIKTQQELLLAIRTGEIQPERSTAYWTPEERAELQRLYRDGQGISEIALLLQRSESAVFQQLLAMGMLAGQGKPRQRNPRQIKCQCPKCLEWECPHYDREEECCCLKLSMTF